MMHAQDPWKISSHGRIAAAGLMLGIVLLLLVASRLTPDPRGFGTHEQLGLRPCSFYGLTGRPCPTCGATTAWALLLDGEWSAGVRANVAAVVLGGLAIVAVPWLLASAVTGRWLAVRPTARGVLVASTAFTAVMVIDWLGRMRL